MSTNLPAGQRLCGACGSPVAPDARFCSRCGAEWVAVALDGSIASLTGVLALIDEWERGGFLPRRSAAALRADYTARLERARVHAAVPDVARPRDVASAPSVLPPAAAAPRPVAAASPRQAPPPASPPGAEAGVRETTRLPRPPRPPRPPRQAPDIGKWATERQADLLLYLGAFLLVVAAVLFVGYSGEALGSTARVAILAMYTLAFLAAGVAVRRWERAREAGPVFLALGALLLPLNFLLLWVELRDSREVSAETIWFLGSLAAAGLYNTLYRRGYGTIYRFPGGLAIVSAWEAAFVTSGAPLEWLAPWNMAGAALLAAIAARPRWHSRRLLMLAGGAAATTLLHAHAAATVDVWPLAASYALLTGGLVATSMGTGWPLARAGAVVSAAAAAVSAQWALGLAPEWHAYPPLAAGFAVALVPRLWAPWSERRARFRWLLAAGLGTVALLLVPGDLDLTTARALHGAATMGLAAALFATIAALNARFGVFASPVAAGATEATPVATKTWERAGFGWTAWLLLAGAVAHAQYAAGVPAPHTGWASVALAVAAAAALARFEGRWSAALPVLLPPFGVATALALQTSAEFAAHNAAMQGVSAAALIAAGVVSRRWFVGAVAAPLAALAAGFAWAALDWPFWSYIAALSAAGAVLVVALTPVRRYAGEDRAPDRYSVVALSWGPLAAAVALLFLVSPEVLGRIASPEFRTLTTWCALVAGLVAFESIRLRERVSLMLAAAFATAALAGAWAIAGWPAWTLAVAYQVLATAVLLATAGYRPAAAYRLRRGDGGAYVAPASVIVPWALLALASLVLLAGVPASDFGVSAPFRALAAWSGNVAALMAFESYRLREPRSLVLGAAFATLAVAGGWVVAGWPAWSLGLAYALTGAALLVASAAVRAREAYRPATTLRAGYWALAAVAVPWGLVATGGLVAYGALPAFDAYTSPEYRVVVAWLWLAAALAAFEGLRLREPWSILGAVALATGGLATLWATLGWPGWTAGLAMHAAAWALLVGMRSWRAYATAASLRGHYLALTAIAAPWALTTLALLAVYERIDFFGAGSVTATVEYRALVVLVLGAAGQIAYDAVRYRSGIAMLGASAVAMTGVLLAIAIAEPASTQAYTVPLAAYFLAVGVVARRPRRPVMRHVDLHEVAFIVAAVTLMAPQAALCFQPGGDWWGFVLLLEGALLLGAGLAVHERWLATPGVLAISGVGLRWLQLSGETIPYWVTLGLAGMLLVGLGVVLLLQRERWLRARDAIGRWWGGVPRAEPAAEAPGPPTDRR